MAGPRSPFPFRYLDKVVGFLVPRSKASFPVPVPHPPFRFLVPRSGSSSPVPVPRPPFRFLVPRSGSSSPVQVPRLYLQIYHIINFLNVISILVYLELVKLRFSFTFLYPGGKTLYQFTLFLDFLREFMIFILQLLCFFLLVLFSVFSFLTLRVSL